MAGGKWVGESLRQALAAIVGPEKVLTDPVDTVCYSYDSGLFSALNPCRPDAVVLVHNLEDVTEVVRWAGEHDVPVVPRGAGTGQAGQTLAVTGGILLDMSPWHEIASLEPQNRIVFCRPGVTHARLREALAPHGLYLPPDPSSGDGCTIGGMTANNSSGAHSLKYGPTSHYVLGLEVVLGTGEVIITGGARGKVLKSVSGLNLNALFVGSEGTLGVITGIWLKVLPRPAARAAAIMIFERSEDALAANQELQKRGVIPSAMEFELCGAEATRAAAEYHNGFCDGLYAPGAEMAVLCEVDGNPAGVAWEYEQVQEVAKAYPRAWRGADDPAGVKELWEALDAMETFNSRTSKGARRSPGGEDICVKLERVPAVLRELQAIARRNGIGMVNFGHLGEGNIHSGLLIRMDDPKELEGARRTMDEGHQLALREGGSTTGEHGVGLARAPYMAGEHGEGLRWMAEVKKVMDPRGIMNPGKIWPLPGTAGS